MNSIFGLGSAIDCMLLDKFEIMDKVVSEINSNPSEYFDDDMNLYDDAIETACENVGCPYGNLSHYDIEEIMRRI